MATIVARVCKLATVPFTSRRRRRRWSPPLEETFCSYFNSLIGPYLLWKRALPCDCVKTERVFPKTSARARSAIYPFIITIVHLRYELCPLPDRSTPSGGRPKIRLQASAGRLLMKRSILMSRRNPSDTSALVWLLKPLARPEIATDLSATLDRAQVVFWLRDWNWFLVQDALDDCPSSLFPAQGTHISYIRSHVEWKAGARVHTLATQ